MAVSKRVLERLSQQLKRYQAILAEAKNRDISESDTIVIVADILADAFGYRKYVEITTEFAIRGTYVDLAVKVDDEVRFLVEGKAIGAPLKDSHVKQAIDYGANHGIEWVVLTNGAAWRVYKIHFKQPIEKSLVFEIDLLQVSPRDPQTLECFANLSREGFTKSSMTAFFQQKQITSKFSLAAVLLGDSMLSSLRRELRRLFPGIRVDEEELRISLANEVLKRELVEGDEAKQASEFVRRAMRASVKAKAKQDVSDIPPPSPSSQPIATSPLPVPVPRPTEKPPTSSSP